jgi:CubicO group peptidase (beta-lactamase class C family)
MHDDSAGPADLADPAAPAAPATAAGLIDAAIERGVIPGAVLAAGQGSAQPLIWHVAGDAQHDQRARRPMTADTIFDLASLTKVVGTLPCVLRLIAAGDIGLDDPAQRYLDGFAGAGKDRVTIRQLLTHTSGLPDSSQYYERLHGPAEVRAAALAEPLIWAPGSTFCYSDIGFIALGELCAAVAGRGLDKLAAELVFGPLRMTDSGYLPPAALAARIASTEAVGGIAKTGVVHDENAEALGGVAGHAGLFGTAADLARYAYAWTAPESAAGVALGLPGSLVAEALRCQTDGVAADMPPGRSLPPGRDSLPGRRGLGWGLRGDRWDNMGDGWPLTGAGHTGFTGTCLSIDPVSGMWLVLLTNAVHFGRGPEHAVAPLRRQVHALVAAALPGSVVQ